MPKFGWEKEIVLPRNATFRVNSIEKSSSGWGHVLHCTYLGTKE
jgi:hypothetical protein